MNEHDWVCTQATHIITTSIDHSTIFVTLCELIKIDKLLTINIIESYLKTIDDFEYKQELFNLLEIGTENGH